MWNLNDSPDHHHEESNGKGNQVGHVSSSMSQSVTWTSSVPPVTRNFFPGQIVEPEAREVSGTSFSCVGQSDPSGSGRPEKQEPVKKSRRGPRSRSSQYRGVTFYRRTGRWESHIWYFIILKPYKIT